MTCVIESVRVGSYKIRTPYRKKTSGTDSQPVESEEQAWERMIPFVRILQQTFPGYRRARPKHMEIRHLVNRTYRLYPQQTLSMNLENMVF